MDLNCKLIAAANSVLITLCEAVGAKISQNKEWLKCPPELFLTISDLKLAYINKSFIESTSIFVPASALFKLVIYA